MPQSPRAMTRSCRRSLNHTGTTSRLHMLAGLALLAAFAPGAASAQATDWPTKPVTVVVPFAAGGNTDIMARIASQKLAEVFKQGFVVENRVGAGGAIAATYAAQAAPDGYTLFFAAAPQIAVLPYVQKVNYDPHKDFTPVSIFGTGPFILAISSSSQDDSRVCRIRQEPQTQLRVRRDRIRQSSVRRAVRGARRTGRRAHSVSRRRSGDDRAARWSGRDVFR